MTIRMTILWRCLLWLERLLLLLLLRYYCGTTAVLLLLLLLLLLRYYCGRWSRCARTATAAAACHCCEPSARRRHYLLWLTYYGYTYHGYTCSTLGQAPPLLTMAIPALPAMPTVAVLSLYCRCTVAVPSLYYGYAYHGYTMATYGYTVAVCLPRAWPLPGASRRWAGVRRRLRQLCDRGARGDGGEAAAR